MIWVSGLSPYICRIKTQVSRGVNAEHICVLPTSPQQLHSIPSVLSSPVSLFTLATTTSQIQTLL